MKPFILAILSLVIANPICLGEALNIANKNLPAATSPTNNYQTPLSEEDIEILNAGRVGTGEYIGGGIASTVLGFGVGAAIQGRYSKVGWIFTVGEVVCLTATVVDVTLHSFNSAITTSTYAAFGQSNPNPFQYIGPVGIAGLAGYGGLRLWEIIDGWVSPAVQNADYDRVHDQMANHRGAAALTLMPMSTAFNATTPGMSLGLSF